MLDTSWYMYIQLVRHARQARDLFEHDRDIDFGVFAEGTGLGGLEEMV